MWTANLFQVTTGAIGPRVNFKSLTWSISLNEVESCSIDLTKADLPSINLNFWLAPWWAGIIIMWNGRPIFAGPIIARPAESWTTFRVECKGIRALFDRRFVVEELSNWSSDLGRSKVIYDGYDHGTVAQLVVKKIMAKPGGSIPISFPVPETAPTYVDKDHQIKYDGYNLGSISGNNALTELSNKTNGPDIMFRPRLIDANSLVWDMMRGNETQPTIPQEIMPIWDTTTENGQVTDLDIVTTGTYVTNRMFATGAGQNEYTEMNVATDNESLAQGFPLLEGFKSLGSTVEDPLPIYNGAKAALDANKKSLTEIQLSVRADGEYDLGTFWPGDLCELVVKGWLSLKDGKHRLRLLNISGSDDGDVRMSLQTEK
jgi:hypothetical protein